MGECHSNNEKCCCSCHTKHADSCHGEGHNEDFSKWLLETADEAWTEVLKEEIKKYIWSTQGDRMAELAKIVAETNNQRWKNKMEKKHGCHEFKEKLGRFFGQNKK